MLFSHRFGSLESLSRARYWMTRLGFEVVPMDPETHDIARLSLNVNFSQASAALALIDSIEASDPEGWPGFMTPPKTIHARRTHAAHDLRESTYSPARSPIHWHPREDATSHDPASSKVSEYMLSRWE
jgi:hypothetical protein